jgi:diguanylate cyclase (GGDEF)-like protein
MKASREFLTGVNIFADLGEEELEALIACLHPRDLEAGEVLFREGDPGGEMYVVQDGSLGIGVTLPDGALLELAAFSRGDFFGEMSIFEREPRSATCTAKSPCRLLSLHERDLSRLMSANPAGAAKMMKRMLAVTRRRLEDTGEFLADMVQWGEEARRRAITDPLTGLYNRRYLEEALEEQVSKARLGGRPLCLVMIDLDHFREINEGYSQELGDRVIVAAAEVFRACLRPTDAAARYGGDEFTFVLPDTDARTAGEVLERIRRGVEALTLLEGLGGPVTRLTTSQGLACFPEHGADARALRRAADAALYKAKELGRNRVETAGQPGDATAAGSS